MYMYVLNRLQTIHILSPSRYDCRLHSLLEDYSLVSPLGHSELTLYLLAVLYTGDGKLSPTYSNNPIMDFSSEANSNALTLQCNVGFI